MKNKKSSALKCSPDYYDFYSIPFPVKSVGRIQKNKYICAQLEKIHPCFSDDCCFDSKLRISNHGLQADIVVMQKFRLAEYKSQHQHKPIYIEELRKIPFFKDYKSRTRNLIIAAAIGVLAVMMIFVVQGRQKRVKNEVLGASVAQASSQLNVELQPSDSFLQIKTLLETVALNDGKITGFSWKLNGFSHSCDVSVKNIYPEQLLKALPQLTVSSVTYERNIPLMATQINMNLNSSNFVNDADVPVNELAAAFRNFVLQKNISIVEETVKPCGIKVRLPAKIELLQSLFEYLLREQISVSSLSINAGKESVLVSIGFSLTQIKNQDVMFESIIENAEVFFEKETLAAQPDFTRQNASPKPPKKSQTDNKKETAIGKIIRTDGTTIEFYKDENGRIKQK